MKKCVMYDWYKKYRRQDRDGFANAMQWHEWRRNVMCSFVKRNINSPQMR